jgi:hypothetical protein
VKKIKNVLKLMFFFREVKAKEVEGKIVFKRGQNLPSPIQND